MFFELFRGFDPRYFVSLLHLLRICVKTLPLADDEAIRRKVKGERHGRYRL